jgi:hexosaminidase
LSDDQGFRVESKRCPKLHEISGEGQYFTQDQIREIVAYAAEREIRVIPEFDMPGHTTSFIVAYPELAALPGPYSLIRNWGIFDPVLDPSKEAVYRFLDGFIGEMAALFPDPYFHIGGDEVKGKQWDASPAVAGFKRAHAMKDNHDFQAYFNQRVLEIVAKHGKTMIGWDDVLHPDLPKDIVVQSWRGQKSLAQAARQGYRGILSSGYYLDLMQPAATHYAVDPMENEAANGLTTREQSRILGGEACMWSEFVTAENVDTRIWPRAAAIAERLWSPREVKDPAAMYERLRAVSLELELAGLRHRIGPRKMLERAAGTGDIQPLLVLADAVEPVKGYKRNHIGRKYDSRDPLNRMVDAIPPESDAARTFGELVARNDRDAIRRWLTVWRDNDAHLRPLLERSFLLQELLPLSAALSRAAASGVAALDGRRVEWPKDADVSQAELLLVVAPHIRKLVEGR